MNPLVASAPACRPATSLLAGDRVLLVAVDGGEAVVERLASLGLVPGTRLRVVRSGSPLAVAVGETRLALGPDWADALRVVRV